MVNGATPRQGFKVTAELGQVGLRRFGGYLQEEFDPDLRGQRGMRRFDEMRRNDPDVGAILWAIEMSFLSVDWTVERAGETPADEEAATFLEQCWDDMSMSPRDLVSDVCTMFPFGFHIGEIVYKLRSGGDVSLYDDGRIGWRKIAPRHQETIESWDYDENGGLRGVWQLLPLGGKVYIPIEKCILFTTRRERGNPEGYSILRNAWHSYYIKTNVQEIEVISSERDMTGIPFMRLPVGADSEDAAKARDILEKLKWDDQAGIVLPRNGESEHQWWDFGTVSSPGAGKIDTDKVIQRCTVAIARSVLAQFLTLGSGAVGSYALSKDMRDLFHLALKGWLDRAEDTVNRYMVARLFKLNDFQGLTALPKLRHGRMGQRSVDIFVSAIEKLVTMGMPVTSEDWNFIRSEMEMPLLPEEVFEEEQQEDLAPTEQPDEDESQNVAKEAWFSRTYA